MITYTAKPGEEIRLREMVLTPEGHDIQVVIPQGIRATVVDHADVVDAAITLIVHQDAVVTFTGQLALHGAQQVTRTVTIQCEGRGSMAALEVSCHTQGSSQLSLKTFQNHTASSAMSTVRIFGVSSQTSRASVASTIFIAPHLGGVTARQVHKHLLLDPGARAVSVPALDILSNDVSCSHGSAITHLDAAQLFYLQARGYDLEAARDTVVKAFLQC